MSSKFIKIGNKKPEYYKGLLIRADEKLHEQIAENVKKHLEPGSTILDLGCGQGALSMRLNDLGYKLLSVDMNKEDFQAKDIPYEVCNFNSSSEVESFLSRHHEEFDCVLGIEVIEHLENPWEYVRMLRSLVKKDGLIVITTPNITSWYYRVVFLMTGLFPTFVDPDEIGHINPISDWELRVIARKSNLKEVSLVPSGTLPLLWINSSIAKTALNLIFLPLFPFMRGELTGWCKLAIFKK